MQQKKPSFYQLITKKVIGLFQRTPKVDQHLQLQINSCKNMDELLTLLFTTKFIDEPTMDAFDKRIDQLEGVA